MTDQPTIRVPLDVPAAKATRFLEYFRARMPFRRGWAADHDPQPDGTFLGEVAGAVEIDGDESHLRVKVRWAPDGSLVEAVFDSGSPGDWGRLSTEWVQGALRDAYSEKLERHYYSDALSYFGSPLEGEYWLEGLRVAPFEPWGAGPLIEQVVTLDGEVEAVDATHAVRVGSVRIRRFAALLSLFLGVGLRRMRAERRWVRLDTGEYVRAVLAPPVDRIPRPTKRPGKGELCPLGRFAEVDRAGLLPNEVGSPLRPPKDIRELFRSVRGLSPQHQEAFIGAASLANIALAVGRDYPSVRLAYWVAAVDALPGKPKGEAAFQQLVRRYCPEAPASVVKYGYGRIRSGHFHAGELPAGEGDEEDFVAPFASPAAKEKGEAAALLPILMHALLIRWLLDAEKLGGGKLAT